VQDFKYYSNNKKFNTQMDYEANQKWMVYWDASPSGRAGDYRLWCSCSDINAVRPGTHTWQFYNDQGSETHSCEFDTMLN
jgi:hypothetical protein